MITVELPTIEIVTMLPFINFAHQQEAYQRVRKKIPIPLGTMFYITDQLST